MEASPLTQQTRPEIFQPKIVQLYEALFKVCPHVARPWLPQFDRAACTDYLQATEDAEHSEGFWREFFLLPPNGRQLHALLDKLSPDETLGLQVSF